eukprot:33804-Eustigmatos_ZCMA.PRE.1
MVCGWLERRNSGGKSKSPSDVQFGEGRGVGSRTILHRVYEVPQSSSAVAALQARCHMLLSGRRGSSCKSYHATSIAARLLLANGSYICAKAITTALSPAGVRRRDDLGRAHLRVYPTHSSGRRLCSDPAGNFTPPNHVAVAKAGSHGRRCSCLEQEMAQGRHVLIRDSDAGGSTE